MKARRFSFWLAVGGVSILSNFLLTLVTSKLGSPGLANFTNFAHKSA